MAFIAFKDVKRGCKFVFEDCVWVKDVMPTNQSNAHIEDPSMKAGSRYFDDAYLVQVLTVSEIQDFVRERRIQRMTKNVKIISLEGHKKRAGVKP